MKNVKLFMVVAALMMLTVYGCEKKGGMEGMGAKMDEAAEDAGEAMSDGMEKVQDAVEGNK